MAPNNKEKKNNIPMLTTPGEEEIRSGNHASIILCFEAYRYTSTNFNIIVIA